VRKFGRFLANLSIKTRLTMLFALVSLIPVCVIGAISLDVSSRTMLEKGVQASQSRLEFIAYRVDEIMREKHRATLLVAFNPYVRAYFDPDRQADPMVEDQARRQIIRLYNSQEATSVLLIGESAALKYSQDASVVQRVDVTALEKPAPSQFQLFDLWLNATWDGGSRVIPYVRQVLDMDNHPVALIRVNVRESLLRALYEGYESARGSQFLIVNDQGTIQSCADGALYGKNLYQTLEVPDGSFNGDSGSVALGGRVLVYYRDATRRLNFLELIPEAALNAGFRPILTMTLLVAALCMGLCVLLGSMMSRSFIKPLYRLIGRVSSYGAPPVQGEPLRQGETPRQGAAGSPMKNEIAILDDQYGKVLEKLETAIGQYYEEQRNNREAQIRALEFQINPHFLYNTLSTIIWLIGAGEDKKAIRITKDLAAFFRISIGKGRDFIALSEQIKHIELYIGIQMARYEDSIFVEYDLPEELKDCLTPRLILQPLVENSIIHGMQQNRSRTCHIRIAARAEGEDILLTVRDDGENATQETIDQMNRFLHHRSEVPAPRNYGIGISNVHDRVQMCFGEGYGLTFARDGNETVATVRIKKVLEH
jgi:two-component system sensor histidine kinase YesM